MQTSYSQPEYLDNTVISLGLISRSLVKGSFLGENPGLGINIVCNGQKILAHYKNIFSTQRNTVLANENGFCICLTEHFLAACALLGISNFDLEISEPELPFDDGSAFFWIKFLQDNLSIDPNFFTNRKILQKPILISDDNDPSRYIEIVPADNFSVTYNLDIKNPPIIQSFSWTLGDDICDFARARTFSNEQENKLLGLDAWILGIHETGFSKELHYPNELAAHKALDLVGDLMLSGINPLSINMKLTSNKAGHALNARAAQALAEVFA
jgi:UDP-3-O-acyl-N-acetylglucosamine deacetylase